MIYNLVGEARKKDQRGSFGFLSIARVLVSGMAAAVRLHDK
jgi:hypothetical protein